MESWSPAWSGYWAKTLKDPVFVWTYWELAQDLSGQAEDNRRTLWRLLIKDLNWPKGLLSFWPMSEFTNGTLTPRPDMFREGIRRLRPQQIACFGLPAFQAIAPDADPALHVQPYKGYTLHFLPDPATLHDSLPDKRLHFIRSLMTQDFSGFVSRET